MGSPAHEWGKALMKMYRGYLLHRQTLIRFRPEASKYAQTFFLLTHSFPEIFHIQQFTFEQENAVQFTNRFYWFTSGATIEGSQ
jgi:hypothetical protein